MALSRRRLLIAAAAIPTVVVVQRAADTASEAVRAGIVALRPRGAGTSATRCAQCGSPDHTMLDPRCPLAPRVLS
jgi:hypothetical protein